MEVKNTRNFIMAVQEVIDTDKTSKNEKPDMVNHPPHYRKDGRYAETIDCIRYTLTKNEPVPWWECKLTGERDINNINRGRMAQCPPQEIENGNNAI